MCPHLALFEEKFRRIKAKTYSNCKSDSEQSTFCSADLPLNGNYMKFNIFSVVLQYTQNLRFKNLEETFGCLSIMASLVNVRPRKQIDYKKLNGGEPLPSTSKVRVSRVYSETFPVERIITRRQFLFIYNQATS